MKKKVAITFALVILCINLFSQKTVFTPTEWSDSNHEYYQRMSSDRMYESENFVLYWGDLVGTDPQNASDISLRFNPRAVADTFEYSFDRFINDLNFISNDPSTNFGKYKTPVIILGTFSGGDTRTEGFAHASSYSGTIGAMFVHPAAVMDGGAISHEYAHTLQIMMNIQENTGIGNAFAGYDWAGAFYEGHANYMRAMRYQKWANVESTLTRWIQTRHLMWSSHRHHYTNYNLLFYVQEKDGFDLTRRLWSESSNSEHPLETLKRLKKFTQEQLNDYLWGYARREVTFDYPIKWNDQVDQNSNFGKVIRNTYQGIRNRMPRYTSREYTILNQVEGSQDRYYVNEDFAPQDYGMNIIPLYPTCGGDTKVVTVKFKGHTEINPDQAGWRYGFVSTTMDGLVSRYGAMHSEVEEEVKFELLSNESKVYFVVFSAPKEHVNYSIDVGYPKQRRYPYELKIANANPEGYQDPSQFRSWWKNGGSIHPNGGGWIGNGASVDNSVFVGSYAMVIRGNITGNVRIEDHAIVEGGTLSGDVIVRDNALVYNADFSGNTIVEGNAWMEGGSGTDQVNVKGNAFLFGANFSGSLTVGGDAEIGDCSTDGVYLQFPYWRNGRQPCDGLGMNDESNQDINPPLVLFDDSEIQFSAIPNCSNVFVDCNGDENGMAIRDVCGKCVGGNTGQISDDSDQDGVLNCEDLCVNDANKTSSGLCGCGVPEDACGIKNDTLKYNVTMLPMSDYSASTVILDAERIAKVFGLSEQELVSKIGTSVTFAAIEPNEAVNLNSTANAPGHWFNQSGQVVAWGEEAYVFSELDVNALLLNVGQFPDKSALGDRYEIKQALIYETGSGVQQYVFIHINLSIQSVTSVKELGSKYISFFPNPVENKLTISEKVNWTVLNSLGLELYKGYGKHVDVSLLGKGFYYLFINGNTYKVIKI